MANTGIVTIDDLRAVKYASAGTYGLDTINTVLQADLNYYNQIVQEQLNLMAESATEQQRVYGTSGLVEMVEVDEFGMAPTKKNSIGETVGFPLKNFQSGLGWTSKFLEIATPAELTERYLQVQHGHAANINVEIKKAIYNNANYSFVDKLTNGVTLGIKRFINADSSKIPNSPAGVAFDGSTHTHYIARTSTLANADVDKAISLVTEHGLTKGLMLVISLVDKATISALTNFKALDSALMAYSGVTSTVAKLDMSDLENQLIGYWNGNVEVWVKPWAVANYVLCLAVDVAEKPLVFRQRPQATLQGLRIVADFESHPLVARVMEAEFGFGVWNRLAGSVLYIGNTTWANPTL
jgi:hypothetical protein